MIYTVLIAVYIIYDITKKRKIMTKGKFDSIKAKESLGNHYVLEVRGRTYLSYLGKVQSLKEFKVLYFYSSDKCIEITDHGKYNTIHYKDVQLKEL